MKLTMRVIEGLACPEGQKDKLFFDDTQTGLAVRVTKAGSKTYLCQYTFAGQRRRVPLGSFKGISLAAARDAASAILGDVAMGSDPAGERKIAAAAAKIKATSDSLTLAILIDDWRKLHLIGRSPKYAKEAVRALQVAFADRLNLPAESLDRKAVVKVLDGMADRDAMAKAVAVYGRALYGWARKRGSVDTNPFEAVPVADTVKRDRVLTDDELAEVWHAVADMGVYGSIVRFLILTGQRREEVAGLVWEEVSPDLTTWNLPASRAKNGVATTIPLAKSAQGLLRSLKRSGETVFFGRKNAFSGWSKAKARLDGLITEARQKAATDGGADPNAVADMPAWRIHDLRRTVATGLQRLGVRLEVTEAVLNHVSGTRSGVVGIYQRHDWAEEKRVALEAWGKHVLAVVEGRAKAGNVVPLQRRGEK